MIWDQATIHELKTLSADGIRPAEIARRMKCSKNVIMGKGRRLGLAYPPQIIKIPSAEERQKTHKLHGDTLPALASLSAPPPTPTIVLFRTVAAPILSIEDRDRRILLMADRSDGQCARLLGISRNVVRHVRAKDRRGTAPEAEAPAAKSTCHAVVAPPEPRAAQAPALPPSLRTFLAPPVRPRMSCQWPTGERTSVYHTHRFCGCAEVVPGKPYCAEHTKLAYVRVRYDGATL
jgi:GcrA cell cycle regulator